MSSVNTSVTLASAVATAGTFTVPFPSGYTGGSFSGGTYYKLFALQTSYSAPTDFTVAIGASSATVTWLRTTTLPAGTVVGFQFDRLGSATGNLDQRLGAPGVATALLTPVNMNLGSPAAAAAAGLSASASIAAAGSAVLLTTTLDVPRNVVGAWTTSSVVTVTGKDVYNQTMVESSASGTTFTGKKAFKTITSIVSSASITSATFGWGDVLGLPAALPQTALVLKEVQDGAVATAGTVVVAATATPSATTGDVRGTYDPNAACDGTKAFAIVALLPQPSDVGRTNFAG